MAIPSLLLCFGSRRESIERRRYTSINVLAGHYASYGPKFPVPEKRRKRLYQEYAEVEKNIKKRR